MFNYSIGLAAYGSKGDLLSVEIAVFSDIHGNYTAFQKCLDYTLNRKIDTYIFLGDYLGEFSYPQKTMDIIYSMADRYTCFFVRGNKMGRS